VDDTHTRLVVRESFDKDDMPPAVTFAIEIPDVVMMQKALNTVKHRAEGLPESVFTTPYEIIVWLAVLVIGLIAGVLFINRKDWRKPLAIGVASVIVLLVLTFLFPPLWLRGVLDLGLLAGLVWSFRSAAEA
jgi:cell division protein FtsW (lipid II flippase)